MGQLERLREETGCLAPASNWQWPATCGWLRPASYSAYLSQAGPYSGVRRNPATPPHHWTVKGHRINPHGRMRHLRGGAKHWTGQSRCARSGPARSRRCLGLRLCERKGGHLIPGGNKQAVDRLDEPVDTALAEAQNAPKPHPVPLVGLSGNSEMRARFGAPGPT